MIIRRLPDTVRLITPFFLLCSLLIPPKPDAVTYAAPPFPGAQTGLKAPFTFLPVPAHANERRSSFVFNNDDLKLLEQCSLFETQIEKNGLIYDDEKLNKYINQVGQTVVDGTTLPERVRWKFRILRDSFANALALPNGSIYLNTGLLAVLENESQLAAILAHEITHVLERHAFLNNRSMRKKILATRLLSAAVTWSPAFGAASGTVYLLASSAQALLVLNMDGYGTKLEKEADIFALKRLSELNYEPKELVRVIRLFQIDYDVDQVPLYYADRSKLQNRVDYLNQLLPANPSKLISKEQRAINRMRYLSRTEEVTRHNVFIDLNDRRFRTAIAISHKLVNFNDESSENIFCLAEAYRALGPRPIELTGEELTARGIEKARKQAQGLSPDELESQLMSTSMGQSAWKTNQVNAAAQYRKALELNSKNASAHRGFGLLLEKTQHYQEALEHYREYLKLAPAALDRRIIQRYIEKLEKNVSP